MARAERDRAGGARACGLYSVICTRRLPTGGAVATAAGPDEENRMDEAIACERDTDEMRMRCGRDTTEVRMRYGRDTGEIRVRLGVGQSDQAGEELARYLGCGTTARPTASVTCPSL